MTFNAEPAKPAEELDREPFPLRSLGLRRASGTRRTARGGRRAAAAWL